MANPTTNFGWVMPTATDLVTDLPADFDVFGQAVDTSLAQLKGGTTGQVLSKTSNTNMAFTWVTPQVGDITAVTAGTGISGGGTTGDVTITNSMATAYTTKGDLVPATGSGAFARLGVGANDTVLTADSTTATGLKWATATSGSMTLLSTTTLSGAGTTISSISGSYTNLQIFIYGVNANTNGQYLQMRPNGAATSTSSNIFDPATTGASKNYDNINAEAYWLSYNSALLNADTNNAFTILIENYANTSMHKAITSNSTFINSSSVRKFANSAGFYNSTSAITSLEFRMIASGTTGNFNGGTVLIYGVK